MFWVVLKEGELFFVNESKEELDSVSSSSHGMNANYDELISCPDGAAVTYDCVEPGDAVKIEEFDQMLDSEWIAQVSITLKSAQHGHIEIRLPWERGGVGSMVLLWDTGVEGHHIVVRRLS